MKENHTAFVNQLQIKDVIRKVQQELIDSQKERREQGMSPLFEVDSLEIEIHFVVQQQSEAKTGVSLAVVEVGADHNYNQEQIQKITLRLKKVENCGEDFQQPVWDNGVLPNEQSYYG